MKQIRYPAVAGMFYPADKQVLKQDIHRYLEQCQMASNTNIVPKAIVVPHAGYVYSGSIAASAYQYLQPLKDKIKRVVLLGPSHRVAFKGLAVPGSEYFKTPLGDITLDKQAIADLLELPQVVESNYAHEEEHSLEVQLPFLQEVLDDFSLVPVVIGDADRYEVAEVIKHLLSGHEDETILVISSDLSHYHSYEEATRMDRATSEAIVNYKPELIQYDDACGRNGIKGLLTIAEEKKLKADIVDLRNSGDTAGSKDRVVGYGAYVFH